MLAWSDEDARAHVIASFWVKKARLCRFAPGENYACSAGFFLSFTGSVKQAPEHDMFFTTYELYDIL
jgi:hypothetical protein